MPSYTIYIGDELEKKMREKAKKISVEDKTTKLIIFAIKKFVGEK